MEYNKQIIDMQTGDLIEGYYILRDAVPKVSSNGKPFLSGSVSDRSGSIEIKVWDYQGVVGTRSTDAGKVIKLRGEVGEFKGTPQISVSNIRFTTSGDRYDISLLVPMAPINVDEVMEEVKALIASISDDDFRRIAETMLERHMDSFANIPAAKSVHHSFLSGLLMHTANMLRSADFLAGLYRNVIDRSLLLAGTLLHDFSKDVEFTFSELGIVTDYSTRGQLLGHLVMGAEEVGEVGRELGVPENKIMLLQHLILSHHGEPDFGAAVRPMCAEAELLSYIDLIDSRMEIYEETISSVPDGCFSNRIFALDRKVFNHGKL